MQELESGPEKRRKKPFDDPAGALGAEEGVDCKYVNMPPNLVGVARAQKAFLEEVRTIAKGHSEKAELLINREQRRSSLRRQA